LLGLKYLFNKGINCDTHCPIPIHLQEAYSDLGLKKGSFPKSEEFSKKILSLPMFPELREEEIEAICIDVKKFLK